MDWITDIIFAIAKEAKTSPQQIRPLSYELTEDMTLVTCEIKGQGLVPIGMPDAIFAEHSGVHTIQ